MIRRIPVNPQDTSFGIPDKRHDSADAVNPDAQEQKENPQSSSKPVLESFKLPKLNWVLWAAMSVAGAALVALLLSLKPESSGNDDVMSDFMFDRWLKSSMMDDDDDYRPRRSSSRRSEDHGGLGGFIPPIIINNPGQSPTILPGRKIQDGGNND